MTATVVIPTWNRATLLADCLEALSRTAPTTPVIVVDNGSTDGTADLVASQHPTVTLLRNDTNEGFAPACNRGAREASTDVVIFLNNDTIPQPGAIDALAVECSAERPVVGCHLVYPDGRTQHAGVIFTRPNRVLTAVNITEPRPSGPRPAVTGACMAVHRDTFINVGGFNEGFRNGYEDVDLCLALGGAWYTAAAQVVHLESMTPGRFDHAQHNIDLLQQRWGQGATHARSR